MNATPFIDELGRSTAIERPSLNERDFIDRVLDALDIDHSDLTGRTKRPEVVRAREILMTLGIERYRFGVKGLASELGVRYDSASLWGRRGAKRRTEDDQFRRRIDEVDGRLAASLPSRLESPNI